MSNLFILKETFTNGLYFDFLIIISLISIICGLFVIIVKNPIVSVLCLIGLFFSIAIYLMMLGIHFIGLSYLLVYVGAVSILFLFILMLINVRISELVTDNNNSIPLAVATGIIFISTLFSTFPSGYKNNSSIYKFFTSLNFNNHLMKENEGNFIVITDMDNKGYLKTNGSIDELKDTPLFEGITNLEEEEEIVAHTTPDSFEIVFQEELLKGQDLSFVTSSTWDGALTEFSHITSIGNILYTVYPMWLIITSLILLLAMVGAIVITLKQ